MKALVEENLKACGININGDKPFDIQVHNDRFYKAIAFYHSLGAGDSYVKGMWDCKQLDEFFFRVLHKEIDAKLESHWDNALRSLRSALFNLQNRKRSRQVAVQHYNIGNTLYELMLGKSMSYTCGYWANAKTLDQAQIDKFEMICRKIDLQPGERVLDLGCGFGTLSKYIAEKYECSVVGVNISEEQIKYARKVCLGLPVEMVSCDFRDSQTYNPSGVKFDKVISVGLCEHVGYKNYRTFMQIAHQHLKDDGLFLLHTIGRNTTSKICDPWISKYIFPNGMIPSLKMLSEASESLFVIEDVHNFGAFYDLTLMAWHENFNANWPKLKGEYGEEFRRMWNYYLLSCAGAFRSRTLQLLQLVLSPKGVMRGYKSLRP